MFTAYIDDSGTAPEQTVANATALVLPVRRLAAFHSEWKTFSEKWEIRDFHSSACAAANPRSEFAGWDQPKIDAVFRRIRQITRKYGIKVFSLSVRKSDIEAYVPDSERHVFGRYYYTYAVHSLLVMLDDFACQSGVQHPLEYVFDWMDKTQKKEKQEIEDALSRSEKTRPGRFAGHYSFEKRQDTPGLQCVDVLAWTCYRKGLDTYDGPPLTALQGECWKEFEKYNGGRWLTAVGQTPKQIKAAVQALYNRDPSLPLRVTTNIV